jgi:hypothetical protein
MEPKTILLIGGLLLIFVGAVLIIGQVAITRRFKEIENSFKRTIMPGLSLVFLGIVLLLSVNGFSFWPK